MNLQKRFDSEPPEWAVVELLDKKGNPKGVYAIPVLEIKKMLSEDFTSWNDSDFHYQYLHRGHKCYISADITLNLEIEEGDKTYFWSFIGTTTFEISTFESENEHDNNENFTATASSLCLVNACSKIGRKFGMMLNPKRDIDYLPNYNEGNSDVPTISASSFLDKKKDA